MSIFFSSGDAGIDLVVDITSGYLDKLMIAPIHHLAIVIGKLLAVGLRSAVQTSIVIAIILLTGGTLVTGIGGFFLILALASLFGMAWSAIGMSIALISRNQRTTQSAFILFFPFTGVQTEYIHCGSFGIVFHIPQRKDSTVVWDQPCSHQQKPLSVPMQLDVNSKAYRRS